MPESRTLGDICLKIIDCEHKTAPAAANGTEFGYLVGTPNIRGGRMLLDGAKRVDRATYDLWTKRGRPREGDIILTREAPVGEAAFVDGLNPVCLGQRTVLLRPDVDQVAPRYLHYLLLSPTLQERMHAQAEGSTVPHLNVSDIRGLRIGVLPSLPEQRAVAAVLGALDDKIAVNERIAATTRDLAVALFRQAVGAESVEESEVGELAELVTRGVTPKYTEDDSELIVLNQKCIREGRVSLVPARRTLAIKVPPGKRLRANDVLVNSTGIGTLGRVARWPGGQEATVDSHVTIVRFDSAKTDVLCAGFAMLAAQPKIERLGEGSTGQTELSRNKIASLSLRLPPREAQASLARQLGELESCGEAALAESQMLAALRDTLLPGLVSGAIRVRDAEVIAENVT